MEFIIILALAFGAMWLMTSRTRKQQREANDFRANLEPGQEVMTGSGLFGTIVEVEGDAITLEIADGVYTRWLRPAIAKLAEQPVDEDDEDDEYDDEDEYDGDEYEDEEYEDEDGEGADDDAEAVEVPDDASSLIDGRDEDGPTTR